MCDTQIYGSYVLHVLFKSISRRSLLLLETNNNAQILTNTKNILNQCLNVPNRNVIRPKLRQSGNSKYATKKCLISCNYIHITFEYDPSY